MTRNRDLKRLVRTRMLKTGEAYTAARAQILRKTSDADSARARVAPRPATVRDAAVKAKTGCGWEHWVKSLDYHGAAELSHAEIAAMVKTKWKVKPWWTQMVAVGYERIRGLRARGQQRDRSYQASKSRTLAVPVGELFDAWADPATRKKWMGGEAVRVRSATKPKSMRLEWLGGGVVVVGFTAKGAGKSSVAVQQLKLPSK